MSFIKEEKAQGSIEYLLLIAAAILLAAVVGLYLKSAARIAVKDVNVIAKLN